MLSRPLLTTFALAIVLAMLLPALPASAGDDRPPLVSTVWLSEHLADADLLLLHVGRQDAYTREHIPGARLIAVRELLTVTEEGLRDEMPPVEKLKNELEARGATDTSHFVICYADAMAIPWAARVYLTLDYLGLGNRTSFLDGGLARWKEEKRPLSDDTPKTVRGEIMVSPREDLFVSARWLNERLRDPALVLIDARPEEQYSGKSESHGPRNGHIPGSFNLPFFTLQKEDPDYEFKDEKELAGMLADAGVKAGSTLVVYCGTGIWASPVYLVARHLGYDVRFYDGGFQEWSADESLPVTEPVSSDLIKG